MDEDNATLSADFAVDFSGVFGGFKTLDDVVGKSTADIIRYWEKAEAAVRGGLGLSQVGVEFNTVANAADQAGLTASKAMERAEQSAIRMTSRLERQIEIYGMTTAQVRAYDAAQKAASARDYGAGAASDKLEAAAARLAALEAAGNGAARGVKSSGSAMAALAPQAQDVFTQVSMGTNVLNVLAIQGGQAASQMVYLGGAAGKFGAFMLGPWGLALTAGALVVGALSSKLLDNEEATKRAEEAMKTFQSRQSDIGNFIDATTGRLIEQNRVLVLNAAFTRQAQIAANERSITEAKADAFRVARNQLDPNAQIVGSPTSGAPIMARMTDPRVSAAIRQANGDVEKLVTSIGLLARTDPKLQGLALQLSSTAGQAVLASRENEKLRKELGLLAGGTTGAAHASASLIEKQVALATAMTPLARARAQLALVQERGAAADKAGGAALDTYRRDLTTATQAVNAAEAAQQGARAAVRDHNKELREHKTELRKAEQAARELANAYQGLQGRFDPIGAAWSGYQRTLDEIDKVQKAGLLTSDDASAYQYAAIQEAGARTREAVADQAKKAAEQFKSSFDDLPDLTKSIDVEVKGLDKLMGGDFDVFGAISRDADNAANSMSRAFGRSADSIGDALSILGDYGAKQDRINRAGYDFDTAARESAKLRLNNTIALTGAAKGMFAEHSRGYQAMEAAEKALTIAQLARTAVDVAGGAAKMFASLGPAGFAAVAAMLGVMGGLGFRGGSGGSMSAPTNSGTGTVFGDPSAQSESLKRSIDTFRDTQLIGNGYSREQLAILRSIDGQIGGVAAQIVRGGDLDATKGISTGFQTNAVGSVLKAIVPIFGGALSSLFGSKSEITGSGIYAKGQTIESILGGGFAAQTYADIQKTSKFLGITTGKKTSTQYGAADPELTRQFALILSGFNESIAAAAGPLGESTEAIRNKLGSFVVNLGRIDLKGLTGEQIEEKLTAVFGAAADNMANAAFPGFAKFQKVGEGAFETLVRVSSTVEAVTASLDMLGNSARGLGIDAKLGLADQFDSLSAMSSAVEAFADAFYSPAERNAAKLAQLGTIITRLGVAMPDTLAGFRSLVEAQNLTTAAGRSTYASLIELAPAFADLKSAMDGAKSAADILAERQELERKLLELRGDTAAIQALDLAKLDASNRALQMEIWGVQAAQEAAKAATDLRDAWASVGDTIMDEVRRIRGLSATDTGNSFAILQGQFNAAINATRGGDLDAAKTLTGLSQSLLTAAGNEATSRQELDRVRAQTASVLESIAAIAGATNGNDAVNSAARMAAAMATAPGSSSSTSAGNGDLAAEIVRLREEVAALRQENNAGHNATASNTGAIKRTLQDVTAQSGGDAIATVQAA